MLIILPVARFFWRRAKFVYDVHEDFANLMLIRDWIPRTLKPLVRRLTDACEQSLARLAHGIVAVTPPLARKFPHSHKVAALNFPTRDFLERASESARPGSQRTYDLVHLGTLNRRRAAFLAESLQEMERRRPGFRSLVVGTTSEIVEFLRTQVPPTCEVLGPISHAEVAPILGDAKVGIDVHPWLQPHLEPALAVKICEYMACGTNVVASSMPVLEEILSLEGERIPGIATIQGGTPKDYADATIQLLSAIEAGNDAGPRLQRFAQERLNWQEQANGIGKLYRSLLEMPCVT